LLEDPVRKESLLKCPAGQAKFLVAAAGLAAVGMALTACQPHGSAGGNVSVSVSAMAQPASVAPVCSTTNLQVSFGQPTGTGIARQHQVRVTLLNRGHSTCRMNGYPGMDLVGDGGDIRLPVPRAAASHAAVSLPPGRGASFTLTYVLETGQQVQGELGAWGPDHIVITAPDATTQQTLTWTLGPVDRSSVRPGLGTSLSPVGEDAS